MTEEDDFQDEDGTRDDYEDESDRDDRLYHQTKDRMAEDRAYWGDAEWRLAQIEGRLEPQREERDAQVQSDAV